MSDKQSILLVDDDREYCKAMRRLLEGYGYVVSIATDGQKALDFLEEAAVDLVISDLKMPTLGGTELMQEINRKKIDIPVFFITAYGEMESYMDLMNMGAFDYLNKPVESREILRVIKEALNAQANSPGVSSS